MAKPEITKAIAGHMVAVYKAMEEESTVVEGQRTYVGKLSQLVDDLGISMTYYSRIFRGLYEGGYAVMEDRGGRNKPSTVFLLQAPEISDLLDLTLEDTGPILSLMKRLEKVETSIGGMYVKGALAEIEKRLQLLEGKGSTGGKKS